MSKWVRINFRFGNTILTTLGMPCDAPDEFSDVAQHWRQNSQRGRKGADQRKMTDPAITAFLDNTAMDVNLLGQSAAVLETD